ASHPVGGGRGQLMAFSPDGTLLAVASSMNPPNQSLIGLFDTVSGEQVRLISNLWIGASSVAFSPDGKTLASWHVEYVPDKGNPLRQNKCILVLWEVAAGKERARIVTTEEVREGILVFSPDGKAIVSPGKESVRFWDVATGQERRHLQGCGEVHAL